MRWNPIPVVVPLAPLVALACAGAVAQQRPAEPLAAGADVPDAAPLFNDADLLFLHHMIMHHEQAVVMSSLVPARSHRAEFVRFTGYVKRAQAAEILLMQSLLDLAASRGLNVPEHPAHGDPPMAGMLSSTQMEALTVATGAEFERLWLEGMIYHHQGALDMAHRQQNQQLATGRRPYALAVLVEDILVEQRAEITKMRAWLSEWGLASASYPVAGGATAAVQGGRSD
jgi:uncharacterized protein (DUF305 family)